MSTQQGFGPILNEIARRENALADAHRHHLARCHGLDQSRRLGQPPRRSSRASAWPTPSKSERIASTFNWEFSPKGQHIELGIAER